MADRYTAALLVSGAVLALVSARQFLAANALVFTLGYLWLALGMQKSFGYNRATGMLPLAMALPAIALVQCCVTLWGDRSRWARWGCNLSLAAAVSLCVAANLRIYFGEYSRWLYFGDETSEAAWLAREYAGQYTVHLIDWYETNQHEPVHDGQRLVLGSLSERERARVHFTPADTNPATQAQNAVVQGSDLFVVWRHDEAARQTLLARFPDARVQPWKRPTDADPLLFLIFVGQPQARESGAPQTH